MKGKILKKIVTFMMVLICAVSIPGQGAQAATIEDTMINQDYDTFGNNPITTMYDCDITMAFRTEGLVMTFSTASLGTASVIGVKDIKVQQKMWYGWKTVLTSPGAENQDQSIFACTVTYSEAVKGKTYRVLCTHYANVDVYEEFENDTGAFKFTY